MGGLKLSAGLILRNERARYLEYALANLLEFVDDIAVVDDGSTDSWEDLIPAGAPIRILRLDQDGRDNEPDFYRHAIARNRLLDFTLDGLPEWVVASDCDEIWTDGPAIRHACETTTADVLTVDIVEVWEACEDCLCTREDGGWRSHPIGAVWRVAPFRRQILSLADKQTATGRVPDAVHRVRAEPTGEAILHFGWSNEAERAERFKRYPTGSGHANAHVESIMWADSRVKLAARAWPEMPAERQAAILERANQP